jgi:tellurite resistance protein TehA-like permease
MKIVGILLLGLIAGVVAASVNLGSGGTLWTALLNYLGFGMIATLLGMIVVIWRAWEAERPSTKPMLGRVSQVSE